MTALLISTMAMYFSMVSSHASQYAVYNHTQANQSAQSIGTIIYKALTGAATLVNPDETGKELLDKMMELNVGESISTTADNFTSLDPTNPHAVNADIADLGAYAVIITCTADYTDTTGVKIFDIAVISSVEGNREIIHMTYNYGLTVEGGPVSNAPGESELFAATGYVPNDAYLDGAFYLTNTFFDTEFTYVGQYDPKGNFLSGNLSTGGSLIFSSYIQPIIKESRFASLSRPTTWAIRGDFFENGGNTVQLIDGSKIMVGGDLYFNQSTVTAINAATGAEGGTIDLYVLGDCYMNANNSLSSVNVHVQGNVYYGDGLWLDIKNLYVNGALKYLDSSKNPYNYDGSKAKPKVNGSYVNSASDVAKWDWSGPNDSRGMSTTEVAAELGHRTQTKTYGKWEIGDSLVNDADGKRIQIKLNTDNQPYDGVDAMKAVYTIALKDSESAKGPVNGWAADVVVGAKNNETGAIVGGVTIDGFHGKMGWNAKPAIILDTGDNEKNVLAIRVKPYIDQDGDGVNETFAWFGKEAIKNTSKSIIVKGRGSVIIDVEEGATYQESLFSITAHYSWFRALGGEEKPWNGSVNTTSDGWKSLAITYYDPTTLIAPGSSFNGKSPDVIAASFVHDNCVRGDGCVYTTTETDTECETPDCAAHSTHYVDINCSKHGKVCTYCPGCQDQITEKLTKFNNGGLGRIEGFCANHLDKGSMDTYFNAHPDLKTAISDDHGIIYPNTNIYLVSISEGTELRFGSTIDGTTVQESSIFGYLYAPYVTFKDFDTSSKNTPKFIGGLIVSDFVISGNNSYLACYPDRMPEELADIGGGTMNGGLAGKTTKSWKSVIGGYH